MVSLYATNKLAMLRLGTLLTSDLNMFRMRETGSEELTGPRRRQHPRRLVPLRHKLVRGAWQNRSEAHPARFVRGPRFASPYPRRPTPYHWGGGEKMRLSFPMSH